MPAAVGVHPEPARGKHPVPRPFVGNGGVLPGERVRQRDAPPRVRQIDLEATADHAQMGEQLVAPLPRQDGHPIAAPFSRAHDDPAVPELDVLHTQGERLVQPEPRPVEQDGYQAWPAGQMIEHGAHLGSAEDHGQPVPLPRARDPRQTAQRPPQHLGVEEHQRGERLVLGGRGDAVAHREVGKEGGTSGSPRSPG